MRTEREIRDQITKSMEAIEKLEDGSVKETIMSQIDALFWVVGDKSGAPVWGEFR